MKKYTIMLFIITIVILTSGCMKPYMVEHYEEIGPNETAFLIPLEGENKNDSQVKFESIEYLEMKKVAAKRVTLPQRFWQTGRMDTSGEWIDSALLIKVDRSPVTREWTQAETTGTTNKNEAIEVESKDSIEFSVGCNLTAMIKEENTSKFLYYYTGKSLEVIIDSNVRSYVQTILGREFGSRDLFTGRNDKGIIFNLCYTETALHFDEMGISVTNIGIAGGLIYKDSAIQEAINDKFSAEMKVEVAKQNKLEQDEINKKNEAKATSEKFQAFEFAKAMQALIKKTELEIAKMNAQANLKRAENWNGQLPSNMMPENSQFLFELDTK